MKEGPGQKAMPRRREGEPMQARGANPVQIRRPRPPHTLCDHPITTRTLDALSVEARPSLSSSDQTLLPAAPTACILCTRHHRRRHRPPAPNLNPSTSWPPPLPASWAPCPPPRSLELPARRSSPPRCNAGPSPWCPFAAPLGWWSARRRIRSRTPRPRRRLKLPSSLPRRLPCWLLLPPLWLLRERRHLTLPVLHGEL